MDLLVSKCSFAILGTYEVWPKGRIVHADHPIAQRFPEHFTPVESAVYQQTNVVVVEQATAAPGEKRTRSRKADAKTPVDPEIEAEG